MNEMSLKNRSSNKSLPVFLALWIVTFVLYLPAAEAGKVGDYYLEWVARVKGYSLRDYYLAPWGDSLYYFILAEMRFFYNLFGLNPWPWHIVGLTLHVVASTFLYIIFYRLLATSKINHARLIAISAALLYCITPYNTEVIVNDHCSSYIPSYLLVISGLLCVQNFIYSGKAVYAYLSGFLYVLSCFCIEVFYLTPFFAITMAWYYWRGAGLEKKVFSRIMAYFVLPQFVVFAGYLALLYKVTHHIVAHRVNEHIGNIQFDFLSNSPKRLFHAILFGRFFPEHFKNTLYDFFDGKTGMTLFGVATVGCCAYIIAVWLKKNAGLTAKLVSLFLTWMLFILVLTASSYFPRLYYAAFDRYLYFILPVVFVLIALLLSRFRPFAAGMTILALYCLTNLLLLIKMNNYWYHSSKIISGLVKKFPVHGSGKTVLLLNPPESLNGVLMVGAKPLSFYDPFSAFKLMYNFEEEHKITDVTGDIVSFNMIHPGDGAHVRVINDSTMNVTLNQEGSRWWQYYQAPYNGEISIYRLNVVDVTRWYQLTLKRPASEYILLYTVGDNWKTVDWSRKNVDQY
jgi:hypothetical protein